MRMTSAAEMPTLHVEQTYKTPPWGMLMLPLALVAISGLLAWAILAQHLPGFFWFSVGVMIFFVPIIIWSSFVPSLRPTNWLLKLDGSRLFIMLRHFRNLQEDPQEQLVIELETHEIESVGKQSKKQVSVSSDSTEVYWTDHHLEIVLRNDPDADIVAAWEKERQHSRGRDKGTKRQPTMVRIEGRSIFLLWNSKTDVIKPGLNHAIERLGRHVAVHEPVVIERKKLDDLSEEELDQKILEYCDSGHSIDAVKLLRKHRGYSLSEAKKFIDELAD